MERTEGPDDSPAGSFSAGTPGVAPPTVVTAAWLNQVQEEIVTIIEDAGLTPDATEQLLTALRILLISQPVASQFAAGYGRQRVVFRRVVSGTVSTSEVWLTINAAWDGTNWVKDTQAADSIAFCLVAVTDSTGPTYGAVASVYKSDTGTTNFTDTDWAALAPIVQTATSMPTSPWINTGGSLSVAKYWRNPIGDICLQGAVSHGGGGGGPTVDPIFTLPAGSRPATELRFPSSYLDTTYKFCTIRITAAGVITTDAAVGAAVRLDGIRFPVGV